MSISDLVKSGELDRIMKAAANNPKNKNPRHSVNISDDILDLIDEIHLSLKGEDVKNIFKRYHEISTYIEYKIGNKFEIHEIHIRNREDEQDL